MSDSDVSYDPDDNDAGVEGEDGEKENGQEKVEELPSFPVTERMIGEGLSILARTGSGLGHAYVRLDIIDKQITDINILSGYVHVRYLDLSENSLKDISPLNSLTHLLTLKADHNFITSPALNELPYLRLISLAHNRLTSTKGIYHPQLHALILNHNQIAEVTDIEDRLPLLDTLELRSNLLTSLDGIAGLPSLRNLYLAENGLVTTVGIGQLPSLQRIHLRSNKLEFLEDFSEALNSLQYINMRDNGGLTRLTEVARLQHLPMLRALLLKGCPVEEAGDYRIEVLSYMRRLERLDKDQYTADDREEAEGVAKQREEKAAEEDAADGEVERGEEGD